MQLTRSLGFSAWFQPLNVPGFNPGACKVKNRFHKFAFTFDLYRYASGVVGLDLSFASLVIGGDSSVDPEL
jgi:hypothetical protein